MALYRGSTTTWTDLSTQTWANSHSWSDVTGTATGNISHTGTAQDLGQVEWVWPTTTVSATNIGNSGITIQYQTSTDGSTYSSAQDAGALYGRYIKTVITADADIVWDYSTEVSEETITRSYSNLNSTTLSGNTAARTLDVSDSFSKVFTVIGTAASTDNRILGIEVSNVAPANLTFSIRDLDTYGKVAVDGNVNIVITGFPVMINDTAAGTVRRGD